MSGKTKRILYCIVTGLLIMAAMAGAIVMLYVANGASFRTPDLPLQIVWWCFLGVYILFPLNVLVHELGHLLFGFLAGMRAYSFSVNRIGLFRTGKRVRFSWNVAGATQMFPKNGERTRGRALVFTLGGILLNVIYAAVFLILFFTAERSPALLFFELFAPLSLAEGLSALYPVELPAGKTDGAVLFGLIRRSPEEDVMLRVLRAQGILNKGSFSELPRELLFDAPVVREDNTAALSLMQLSYQKLLYEGETELALRQMRRLKALDEYLPEDACVQLDCEIVYCRWLDATGGEGEDAAAAGAVLPAFCAEAAYYRALACLTEGDERTAALEKAYRSAERACMKGMREYEKKLLGKISAEE